MSTDQLIDEHATAIAEALRAQASAAFERLRAAEAEAMERISRIAPADYDYDAAARYLGLSLRTMEAIVARRDIAFRKEGRRVFFTQSALDQYRASQTVEPRPVRPLSL